MSESIVASIEAVPYLEVIASCVLRDIFQCLNAAGMRYCVLHSYANMSDFMSSEVDLVVDHQSFKQAITMVRDCAERRGWLVINYLEHNHNAVTLRLATQDRSAEIHTLLIDLYSDFRWNELVCLSNETLLYDRQLFRCFFVPTPHVELAYSLAKRILKRTLRWEDEEYLTQLYKEDPTAAQSILEKLWGRDYAVAIAGSLDRQDCMLSKRQEQLRHRLRNHLRRRTILYHSSAFLLKKVGLLKCASSPMGYVIAVLGPDGAGKTTLIAAITRKWTRIYRRVDTIHFRPRLFGSNTSSIPVTNPHAKPNRSALISILKLLYYVAEYIGGYYARVWGVTMCNGLVIFDRYFHDILVDPRRYRFGAPLWIVKMFGRFVPQPDCVIVLDASVDILHSRKTEVSREEAVRQRATYQELATSLPNAEVVDASQPIEDVIASVNTIILNRLATKVSTQIKERGLH